MFLLPPLFSPWGSNNFKCAPKRGCAAFGGGGLLKLPALCRGRLTVVPVSAEQRAALPKRVILRALRLPRSEQLRGMLGFIWIALGGSAGAAMGSFVGCALYRAFHGLSLTDPRHSFCPSCRLRLQAVDLIPILSWLWFRGRCRRCNAAIGLPLLAIEISGAALGAFLAYSTLP
jgi:hypothetical protein